MSRKKPLRKRFKNWLVYRFAGLLKFVFRYMPVRLSYALGSGIGRIAYRFARRERQKVLSNLRKAFGPDLDEKQSRKLAREVFKHLGVTVLEIPRLPGITKKWVEANVEFQGLEMVQRAIDKGRGVVVATGHIGNWELFGASASRLGIPVNVIARKVYDPRINELIIRLRAESGVKTILRESPGSAKEILRCLRKGEMLALLIDQDIQAEGTFVPFFGEPAFTPTGAAALAARTGALFIAASIHRVAAGRHVVHVEVIDFPEDIDRNRAIIEATARATGALERWIRERPEQWSWNHNRWRTKAPIVDSETGRGSPESTSEDFLSEPGGTRESR